MAKNRVQTVIALTVVGVGLLVAAIMGRFAYMSLTARPLHPDLHEVRSVTRSAPGAKWTAAVERARRSALEDLTQQNLPGLSVAVGVGGEIVWAEGFGWADLENHAAVTPETRFRAGEVSKAFTSAAVGLLLEKNALNLDDEIQKYVPDFPKKQWPVTVRHLMAHSGGIRDDAGDEASLSPCERTADGLRLFADEKLRFEPGTKYQPSSFSWILVSGAVETAGGERFFKFMRSRIFEPLGMSATRPDSAAEAIADRATFYFPKFGGDTRYGPEDAREGDHSCYAGGGAFLSTPSDLVRFGMAVSGLRSHDHRSLATDPDPVERGNSIAIGTTTVRGGSLLKPETVRLLQTQQRLSTGEETGYGLGWELESLPLAGEETRMAGHGTKSDFIGGTSYLMTFPDRGVVVAVMTNTSFADAKSIASKVADAFATGRKDPAGK